MRTTLDEALRLIGISEGGYMDHPEDPGGPTNYGITQAVYSAWLRKRGRISQPVNNIKLENARQIMLEDFWPAVRGDDLPVGVDYVALDCAIHHGRTGGPTILQRAVNSLQPVGKRIAVDGIVGAVTLDRIDDLDPEALIRSIYAVRIAYMKKRPAWKTFQTGWLNRAKFCHDRGLELARKAPKHDTEIKPVAWPHPSPTNPAAQEPKVSGNKMLIYGLLVSTALAVLQAIGVM